VTTPEYSTILDPQSITKVEQVTEGAACTVLLATDFINNDEPLLLVNSDQFVDFNIDLFIENAICRDLDGSIVTFTANENKWSFAKLDPNTMLVTEVAEKRPISNIATAGIYYWKRGADFVQYAHQMIEKNIKVNNEFYVCPVFNEAILNGKKVGVYQVDNMYGFGTVEDWKKNEKLFDH